MKKEEYPCKPTVYKTGGKRKKKSFLPIEWLSIPCSEVVKKKIKLVLLVFGPSCNQQQQPLSFLTRLYIVGLPNFLKLTVYFRLRNVK